MNYNTNFYTRLSQQASESAKHLVPTVYAALQPNSVLDIGCGHGSWLKEWSRNVSDVFGVDGEWVNESKLEIPNKKFKKVDLEKKFSLERKFDLVTCLEVAEHVTEESKDSLIDSLVDHSEIILFSAAIPEQGGNNHYNEQWPSYWKEAFAKRGYIFLDPFRHIFWNNQNIKYYYRQNILLFATERIIKQSDFLTQEKLYSERSLIDVIHPMAHDDSTRSVRKSLPIFLKILRNAIKNRLGF